jgi:Ca-activated chloride channel family protein
MNNISSEDNKQNKQTQPIIRITPLLAGAPRNQTTAIDFLVDILMPPRLPSSTDRPQLNVAIAIDISGSMSEISYEEKGEQVPGCWEQRRIAQNSQFPSPFPNNERPWHPGQPQPQWSHFQNEPWMNFPIHVGHAQNRPRHYEGADVPAVLCAPAKGFEWSYIPPHVKSGERVSKMTRAKDAAINAIDMLVDTDRIAVVTFESKAKVIFASDFATPTNKNRAKYVVSRLDSNGGTALHDGWRMAAEQVCQNLGKNTVNRVILLTDGQAQSGITDPKVLAQHTAGLVEHGVTTSTFGVGQSYSEDLLQAMAEAGDGRYYYLDESSISEKFAEEFSGLSQMLGRRVMLETIAGTAMLLKPLAGRHSEVKQDKQKLANAVRGNNQQVLVCASVSGAPEDGWKIAFTLGWTDTAGVEHEEHCSFMLPSVSDAAFASMTKEPRVAQRIEEVAIAEAKKAAVAALDRGDFAASRSFISGATAMASASQFSGVNQEVDRLNYLSVVADSGDMAKLRKSASYDVYETTNSRKST